VTSGPVSVKGVVLRNDAVVLLKNERGEWELPGGKLEPDETPESCVVREIAEECSLAVEAISPLGEWTYQEILPPQGVRIVTFGCRETERADPVLSHEHSDLRWFNLDQVPGLNMPQGYKDSIDQWARMERDDGAV
jgi:8-oxo-dGTP pyrophosphatase MutT (NUDIX family)